MTALNMGIDPNSNEEKIKNNFRGCVTVSNRPALGVECCRS